MLWVRSYIYNTIFFAVFSFSADKFYHGAFRDAVFSSDLSGEELLLMNQSGDELGADIQIFCDICKGHSVGVTASVTAHRLMKSTICVHSDTSFITTAI